MQGTHPPSTNGSPRLARRAVTTSLAALGAAALPVALVAVTASAPASAPESQAAASSSHSTFLEGQLDLVQARVSGEAVRFQLQASPAEPVVLPTTTTAPPVTTTTAPPPPPPPAPAPSPPPPPPPAPAPSGGYGDPNDPASWDRLAQCESGGNWSINSGNGYYGGLQFSLSSWQSVGGTGYPHEHSRETQIEMGQRLHAQGGWGHWPSCSSKLGYR